MNTSFNKMSCFKFPTKIMVVDDNVPFLKSLELSLKPFNLTLTTSSDIEESIKTINESPSIVVSDWIQEKEDEEYGKHLLEADISGILNLKDKPPYPLSTLIVDYSMPEMTGLELLSHIKDKDIFKVLLTAEADETIAVQALNDNIIDYYVKKRTPDLADTLSTVIQKGENAFFWRKTSPFVSFLKNKAKKDFVLEDPNFLNCFTKFLQSNDIEQYYLLDDNGSFFTRDFEGNSFIFASLLADIYDETKTENTVSFMFDGLKIYLPESEFFKQSAYPIIGTSSNGQFYFSQKKLSL